MESTKPLLGRSRASQSQIDRPSKSCTHLRRGNWEESRQFDTIAALGIPGISNALAARLAVQVGTLAGLAEADMADIELDGAGEASVAKGKLVAWMDANRAMVRDLAACGLGARDPVAPAGSLRSGLSANATATARASIVEGGNARSGPWAGKRVRITGAIEGHTRGMAAAVAESLGANGTHNSRRLAWNGPPQRSQKGPPGILDEHEAPGPTLRGLVGKVQTTSVADNVSVGGHSTHQQDENERVPAPNVRRRRPHRWALVLKYELPQIKVEPNGHREAC